jgi:hypothetical protein
MNTGRSSQRGSSGGEAAPAPAIDLSSFLPARLLKLNLLFTFGVGHFIFLYSALGTVSHIC